MVWSKEVIQKTLSTWGQLAAKQGVVLTEQDAVEILDNTIGLYSYLLELKRKYDAIEGKV